MQQSLAAMDRRLELIGFDLCPKFGLPNIFLSSHIMAVPVMTLLKSCSVIAVIAIDCDVLSVTGPVCARANAIKVAKPYEPNSIAIWNRSKHTALVRNYFIHQVPWKSIYWLTAFSNRSHHFTNHGAICILLKTNNYILKTTKITLVF